MIFKNNAELIAHLTKIGFADTVVLDEKFINAVVGFSDEGRIIYNIDIMITLSNEAEVFDIVNQQPTIHSPFFIRDTRWKINEIPPLNEVLKSLESAE